MFQMMAESLVMLIRSSRFRVLIIGRILETNGGVECVEKVKNATTKSVLE